MPDTALETLPHWDLSQYYGKKGDPIEQLIAAPEIERDLREALRRAQTLRDTYKEKDALSKLSADELGAAISEFEAIDELFSKPVFFISLAKRINLTNDAVKQAAAHINTAVGEIKAELIPFEAQIKRLDETVLQTKLASSPSLQQHAPWLKRARAQTPYQLSDEREQQIQTQDYDSRKQWIDRQNALAGSFKFAMPSRLLTEEDCRKHNVTDKTGETLLGLSEIMYYLTESYNEEARKAAFFSRAQPFKNNVEELADITGKLALHKAAIDKERGYATPLTSRNLSNEVEDDVIESLVKAVKKGTPDTSQRYYKLKAKMMGKEKLDLWDVNAPLPFSDDRKVPWQEAKDTILAAFNEFSPKMGAIAQQFFDNHWIDAEPRAGKYAGGFCEAGCKSAPPAVLLNYFGKPDQVRTLGHELGHGIHAILTRMFHGQLIADVDRGPITMAEVPASFAEEIVFQYQLKHAKDDNEKKTLLTQKIEALISTISRQVVYHQFEVKVHTAAREGRKLSAQELGKEWMTCLRELYGPAVNMDKNFSVDWARITHFVNYPFYVNAYAFAGPMANNLYNQKDKVENFADKILEMNTQLSVTHHSDLMKPFGLDSRDPKFWEDGMDLFKKYVDELEAVLAREAAAARAGGNAHQANVIRADAPRARS